MARTSTDASNLLRCHRTIEAYCTGKTDELLKYMDTLFFDLKDVVEKAVPHDHSAFRFTVNSTIEELRLATEKSVLMTHLHRMQLDVLARAIQRKEEDMKIFEERSSFLPSAINSNILSRTVLPTLPVEILSRIFSQLYWIDNVRDAREMTLNTLVEDNDTADEWKQFFQNSIPIAVATAGAFDMVSNGKYRDIIGPHPRVLRISQLGGDPLKLLTRQSTVIFAASLDVQEMEEIQQFPWRNLVLSTETVANTSHKMLMRAFVKRFNAKLDLLDFLEIRPSQGGFVGPSPAGDPPVSTQNAGHLESKLRNARLQLGMLPTLKPFLCNITDLEIIISHARNSPIPSATTVLESLAPYSNSLISLKICYPKELEENRRFGLWGAPGAAVQVVVAASRVSFPMLKRLSFSSFTECYVKEMLLNMDASSLHHLSMAFIMDRCRCPDRVGLQCITATMLHSSFSTLESISLQAQEKTRNVKFFNDLQTPHEAFGWLLPNLNTVEMFIDKGGEEQS
ncbi:hypothetical protein SCHPADRAFT_261613 [Schizopora paradoxa]|uniref:Uncharacterized protein n=1 Tax=Schizopora paradoxa TaxID=27342 RepID=A0A0H2RV37_9AGAM|nr:hypothetical protein SCHPADRAFT_261613 [Schizopora paradoxa]